ncbi:hypothetical protein WISP_139289 [Willisornis vidua]|uniref:Uncharacterized protein n=1 Tax=Willisornis vidua TaxID=1566151 RepID=A0ABQ9CSJ9_9PASS|nr:hypothetical protein WISP_139289 [Willisornis vidua]
MGSSRQRSHVALLILDGSLCQVWIGKLGSREGPLREATWQLTILLVDEAAAGQTQVTLCRAWSICPVPTLFQVISAERGPPHILCACQQPRGQAKGDEEMDHSPSKQHHAAVGAAARPIPKVAFFQHSNHQHISFATSGAFIVFSPRSHHNKATDPFQHGLLLEGHWPIILQKTEDAHCFTSANEINASINYSFRVALSGISDHALNGKYILIAQAGILHYRESEAGKQRAGAVATIDMSWGGFLRKAQMLTDAHLLNEECSMPVQILGWVKFKVQTENPEETKCFKGYVLDMVSEEKSSELLVPKYNLPVFSKIFVLKIAGERGQGISSTNLHGGRTKNSGKKRRAWPDYQSTEEVTNLCGKGIQKTSGIWLEPELIGDIQTGPIRLLSLMRERINHNVEIPNLNKPENADTDSFHEHSIWQMAADNGDRPLKRMDLKACLFTKDVQAVQHGSSCKIKPSGFQIQIPPFFEVDVKNLPVLSHIQHVISRTTKYARS